MLPYSTLGDHNVNNLESTLPENGSTREFRLFFPVKHLLGIFWDLCLNSTPNRAQILSPGLLFFNKFRLQYQWMLSHNFQQFSPSSFQMKIFNIFFRFVPMFLCKSNLASKIIVLKNCSLYFLRLLSPQFHFFSAKKVFFWKIKKTTSIKAALWGFIQKNIWTM